MKPFWFIIVFLSFSFIALCCVLKASLRKYDREYQNKYDIAVKNHDIAIKNSEKSWMVKLWDRDLSKTYDAEINYLFSQKALKTMLSENNTKNDNVVNFKKQYLEEELHCSIVLYNPLDKEEIDIQNLTKIFANRFEKEDENISFQILCLEKKIYFSSAAAFCQIIYSIVSYLFFLLKKQLAHGRHDIKVVITNIAGKLLFNFSYTGVCIEREKNLFGMLNEFVKIHPNPFILSLEQIFNLLRLNGFNCKVSHEKTNLIEISEKAIKKNKLEKCKGDNIIYLTDWNKEK